jgi:hypothetical protein
MRDWTILIRRKHTLKNLFTLVIVYTPLGFLFPIIFGDLSFVSFGCITSPVEHRYIFVTCYFPFPSKHKFQEYLSWIRRLLHIFAGELYFYSNAVTISSILNGSSPSPNIHFRLNYSEPFSIPCVAHLRSVYADQWLKDRQKHILQGPALYAVWNAKIPLLREVSLSHPHAIVFWIDAGSCREEQYSSISFPDNSRLVKLFPNGTDGVMVFAMAYHARLRRYPPFRLVRRDDIIGTFFGGDHAAIMNFYEIFWKIHNYFLSQNKFVGDDQFIMTTYVTFADKVWIQPNYEGGKLCDPWFATFSFYTNVSICFPHSPRIYSHRNYLRRSQHVNFSFSNWL